MFDAPTLADPQVMGTGDVRAVAFGSDRGLFVEFRMESEYQSFRSEKEGHPVYEQVPYITIYVPGDNTKRVDRPVRMTNYGDVPPDTARFPAQWDAFQRGVKAVENGLPLAQWPIMTTSQVKELNAVNIYTVEQLSGLPDTALEAIGHGGRLLRDKAIAHLEAVADTSATARMVAQNADLQRQIDELKASMSEDAPRRGRPPKAAE